MSLEAPRCGRRLTAGSLFSGAGGFDLGFEAAGFDIRWQVEVDRDCIDVLTRHWPATRRYGDVREVDPSGLEPVDVVMFGSPCQDLSVAGKRAGLAGERSGLFHEAARIIGGLRPAPAFCLWENVPGALSSSWGRDFGAALDALADIGALDLVWRVLDARWFGVPQRRRRIFLVADFGGERAGSVLLESESGSGDLEACGEAGQGLAGDVEDGAGIVGWKESQSGVREADVVGVQDANYGSRRHNGVMTPVAAEGGNRTSGPLDIATACNAHGGPHGRQDFESETFVVDLTNASHSASIAGTVTTELEHGNRGIGVLANSVQASAGHHGHSSPRGDGSDNLIPVAFHLTQDPPHGGTSPAVGAGNEHGCSTVAVALSENQRAEVRETTYARQITAGGGKPGQGYPSIRQGTAVRRLTPLECERLMGWPDSHTAYRADGREIPDGPRYRMIGNGVAAPVGAWIARRMRAALESSGATAPSHQPEGRLTA